MAILKLKNLVVGYEKTRLSTPLNLELPAGDTLGIIGNNGSGKSTLLKTLTGILPALDGQIQWAQDIRLGYVPQENQVDMLFPLTVSDLMRMDMLPSLPRLRSTSPAFRKAQSEILEEMEIQYLEENLVRDLSGGERQRALIGRAWISRPQVLLMDEPFNSIDYRFREKLWRIFSRWKNHHDLTLIMIDHDLNRILNQVQWLIVLGPEATLCGRRDEILQPNLLSQAYGAPLHVHQENGQIQIHFL